MIYENNWEDSAILEAYNSVKMKIPHLKIDSLKVVKNVIKHRNFWKPVKVKTLMLAESHVYTEDDEMSNELLYPNEIEFNDLPKEFIKLVYCLGYGEQALVPLVYDNSGTWQYWKMFAACASESPKIDFNMYLKGGYQSDIQRLRNKLTLLKRLKEKGIWLVDSSIVALYGYDSKPKPKIRKYTISICWDKYINLIVNEIKPQNIILIGKSVSDTIKDKIIGNEYRVFELPQPQKRMSTEELEKTHLSYQKICNS